MEGGERRVVCTTIAGNGGGDGSDNGDEGVAVGGVSKECKFEGVVEATYATSEEKDAAEWVQRVLEEPLKAFTSNTLSRNLKDGTLVCRLLNKVRPGTVKTIHNSHMGIYQMLNIEAFRLGCLDLGIPGPYICEATTISEMKSTVKVVYTIFAVAAAIPYAVPDYRGPMLESQGVEKLRKIIRDDIILPENKCRKPALNMDDVEKMLPPQLLSSRAKELLSGQEIMTSPRAICANLDPSSMPPRTPSLRSPVHKRYPGSGIESNSNSSSSDSRSGHSSEWRTHSFS